MMWAAVCKKGFLHLWYVTGEKAVSRCGLRRARLWLEEREGRKCKHCTAPAP